jgi:hypothetical protein
MKIWKKARGAKASLARPDFARDFGRFLQQGHTQAALMYTSWDSSLRMHQKAQKTVAHSSYNSTFLSKIALPPKEMLHGQLLN